MTNKKMNQTLSNEKLLSAQSSMSSRNMMFQTIQNQQHNFNTLTTEN